MLCVVLLEVTLFVCIALSLAATSLLYTRQTSEGSGIKLFFRKTEIGPYFFAESQVCTCGFPIDVVSLPCEKFVIEGVLEDIFAIDSKNKRKKVSRTSTRAQARGTRR